MSAPANPGHGEPNGGPQRETAAMSVGSAAVWAMASQYVTFTIQFATSVVISRYFLRPDEVGLFSIALAAALLVAVLQDFGLTRYIAGLPVVTAQDAHRCSSVAVLFSLVVSAIIALLAWPMAQFYAMPALVPLLVIIGASYLFVPLAVVPMALMSRAMRFQGHFAVNVGGAVGHAVVALVLAWLGFSTFALAWATLASALCRGLIAQAMQRTRIFPLRIDSVLPILAFGSKTSALYMTGALGTRTPDMVVGKLVNLTAVGLFSRATSLAEQFRTLIAGAIGGVFYPAFARIRDRGEPLGPPYLRVCAGYSAVVWPGMAGLALAAEPLVRLLYGPTWIGTAPLLTVIALNSALMISLPLVTELPILTGRLNRLLALNMVETIASIGLLVAGSLWGGAWGAALSRLAYGCLFMAMYLGFMADMLCFRLRDWLIIQAKTVAVTAATLAPLMAIYLLWQPPAQAGLPALIVAAVLGGGAWIVSLVAVRHPALDDLCGLAAPLANRISPSLGALIAAVAPNRSQSA